MWNEVVRLVDGVTSGKSALAKALGEQQRTLVLRFYR